MGMPGAFEWSYRRSRGGRLGTVAFGVLSGTALAGGVLRPGRVSGRSWEHRRKRFLLGQERGRWPWGLGWGMPGRRHTAGPQWLGGPGRHHGHPSQVELQSRCNCGQVLQAQNVWFRVQGQGGARVCVGEGSHPGPGCVGLPTLLSQKGTVIVSSLPHRVDAEMAQSPLKGHRLGIQLSKEKGSLGVQGWVPGKGQ